MIEAGVPDFTSVSFTAVVAPAGTPTPIVQRLNAAINESLKSPRGRRRAGEAQRRRQAGNAGGVRSLRRPGTGKWAMVVKAAGVQVE